MQHGKLQKIQGQIIKHPDRRHEFSCILRGNNEDWKDDHQQAIHNAPDPSWQTKSRNKEWLVVVMVTEFDKHDFHENPQKQIIISQIFRSFFVIFTEIQNEKERHGVDLV